MELVAPAVRRALAHARRFPSAFWLLVVVGACREFGSGVFFPYWAIYLTDTLGASGAQAGALIAIAGGMGLVGAPLGGILADRVGRRRTLLLGLVLVVAGFFAYASLSSLLAIALLSPVIGIASDIEAPAVAAAVADVVEPELRAEAYGLLQQAQNFAFALGPPVGALIILVLPLRSVFAVAGAMAVVGLVLVWLRLPETRPPHPGHERPLFRSALRDRRLLALSLGLGLSVAVYAVFDGALGPFLHRDRGYAIATWGLVYTLNPIVIGLTQYPIARWAGRRSPRAILGAGILLQGLSLILLWPFRSIGVLLVAVLLLTVGEMFLAPVGTALAAALAPAHLRGSYQGVLDVAFAAFWAPGVLGGLWLVGIGRGELMLALALPVAALGAVCFLGVPRTPVPTEEVLPVPAEASAAP